MNLEQPLQLPDSLLCQLPALITCSWVPGFGVYIRHLTLPLLPLAVYNRQTWDILKPAHASSFPKPSSLLQLALEEQRECRFPERELKSGRTKLTELKLTTRTHRILVRFYWLFAKFSKQNHRHTCKHMHTNAPSPPFHLHKNTFSGPACIL